jgi:hypothetical protein
VTSGSWRTDELEGKVNIDKNCGIFIKKILSIPFTENIKPTLKKDIEKILKNKEPKYLKMMEGRIH